MARESDQNASYSIEVAWVMYDDTIVVLYQKPGLDGDASYTCKANYGLNAQVSTLLNIFLLRVLKW